MDAHDVPRLSELIGRLQSMSESIRAGREPGRVEVEQALERGFGALVQLEARLQNVRRAGASGSEPSSEDVLENSIGHLRDALTELQTLTSAETPPQVSYGFVLPEEKQPDDPNDPAGAGSPPSPGGGRQKPG